MPGFCDHRPSAASRREAQWKRRLLPPLPLPRSIQSGQEPRGPCSHGRAPGDTARFPRHPGGPRVPIPLPRSAGEDRRLPSPVASPAPPPHCPLLGEVPPRRCFRLEVHLKSGSRPGQSQSRAGVLLLFLQAHSSLLLRLSPVGWAPVPRRADQRAGTKARWSPGVPGQPVEPGNKRLLVEQWRGLFHSTTGRWQGGGPAAASGLKGQGRGVRVWGGHGFTEESKGF